MTTFDDVTIERLIGAEDAENENGERFKEYFYYNRTYDNLVADLPIRILVGHKGIGKSALLRRAFLENEEKRQLAIWIRPNDLVNHVGEPTEAEFNSLIERWKAGLLASIVEKVITRLPDGGDHSSDWQQLASSTAKAALGVIGKLLKERLPTLADATTKEVVENYLKEEKVYIYIDDIDRGWTASKSGIKNISALLNAIRDLAGSRNSLMFRIGLRTDVYYLVRTSDESTDKIERHVIWLSWTNHEILAVIATRIETYFGTDCDQKKIASMRQANISKEVLSKIIAPEFEGRGHWSNRPIHNVLLSLTRKRPRDLVKLLHGAARIAYLNGHGVIHSADLEAAFEGYSTERLQDTINEYRSELSNIEHLLFGMRPTRRGRRTAEGFRYATDQLVAKIRDVMSSSNLHFTNGRVVSPSSLIQFLYKIDFVIARRDLESGIDRKYFDQSRFLANEFADFGYDWEIHPAYRWALQPQDVHYVIEKILA